MDGFGPRPRPATRRSGWNSDELAGRSLEADLLSLITCSRAAGNKRIFFRWIKRKKKSLLGCSIGCRIFPSKNRVAHKSSSASAHISLSFFGFPSDTWVWVTTVLLVLQLCRSFPCLSGNRSDAVPTAGAAVRGRFQGRP